MQIAAFPKCYIDQIAGDRTMSVFDWIDQARSLDADGLEMYDGFFTSLEPVYLDQVGEAIAAAGFAMPMLCCSPDFTNPDADGRKRAVDRQATLIAAARRLGGPRTVCRVLSGQRYPEIDRRQGLEWVAECINQSLIVAREQDIVLGLENHYKDSFWKYPEFAQKMDVFLELLEMISDRDHFGVQYDPSNAIVAGDDPIALLRRWPAAWSACTPVTGISPKERTWTTCGRPTARSAIHQTCVMASPARGSTIITPSSASSLTISTAGGSVSRMA